MGNSRNYSKIKEREFEVVRAHLGAAKSYAQLSRSLRLKVGAVIVRDNRIVSIGFNGMPSGASNICEVLSKDGYDRSMKNLKDEEISYLVKDGYELKTKPDVIHAEANAILFAAKNGISTDGCSIITTHSTCMECGKMLSQAGIKKLYYEKEYRDLAPLGFLKSHGVEVNKIDELFTNSVF